MWAWGQPSMLPGAYFCMLCCCRIQQQEDWTKVLPGFSRGKEAAKDPQEASV